MIELSNIIALTQQEGLVYFEEHDMLSNLGINSYFGHEETNAKLVPFLTDYRDHFSLAKRMLLPGVLGNHDSRRQDTCYIFHYTLSENQIERKISTLSEQTLSEDPNSQLATQEYLDWFSEKFPSPSCLKIHTRLNTTIISTQENTARTMRYLKQAPQQTFQFLDGITEEPVSIAAGKFHLPRVQIYDFVSKPYRVKSK